MEKFRNQMILGVVTPLLIIKTLKFIVPASGVGKSTQIKNEILQNGKDYIYMPLGGEFTREEIIKRLLKIIGFTDFFKEFKILTLFQNTIKLEKNKLAPLIITNEIDSDIQVVCNYLQKLEQDLISNNNIIFPGISFSENDIKAEILSQATCEELIKKHFNEGKSTYYQISSFISFLALSLKKN